MRASQLQENHFVDDFLKRTLQKKLTEYICEFTSVLQKIDEIISHNSIKISKEKNWQILKIVY